MSLNKLFVPYLESLELKELGFDEPCFAYYLIPEVERTGEIILHYCSRGKEILRNNDWNWVYENFPMFRRYLKSEHLYKYSTNSSKLLVSAPTYSQAFKWLLKHHNLYGAVLPTINMEWTFKTLTVIQGMVEAPPYVRVDAGDYSTIEEAELACLKTLIKIVKDELDKKST